MTDKGLYVGVADPTVHRKTLLLCSRDLINSLKNYERLKAIRMQKVEATFNVRKLLQEIIVLNRKLKQFLPKVEGVTVQKPSRRRSPAKKPMPKSRVKTKVDILQRELEKIEGKLKKLE